MTQAPLYAPVLTRPAHGGTQRVYRFPNGYGASVVHHQYSYGTELAVLQFRSEDHGDYELVYNTPVTDDVLGYLTEDGVQETLSEIAALQR